MSPSVESTQCQLCDGRLMVPPVCDVIMTINGVVPSWRQRRCLAWAWSVIWFSSLLALNTHVYYGMGVISQNTMTSREMGILFTLIASSNLSQIICVCMAVHNRNELFQLINSPGDLGMITEARSNQAAPSPAHTSGWVAHSAHRWFRQAYICVVIGMLFVTLNNMAADVLGERPIAAVSIALDMYQLVSEALMRALPMILLVGSCEVHVKRLQCFVHEAQYGAARTSATRTTKLYQELKEGVRSTNRRWRLWLLAVASVDCITIGLEVLRIVMDREKDTLMQLMFYGAGIFGTSLYLASLVLPVASWNDTSNNKAPQALTMQDENHVGVSGALLLLTAQRCKMHVAGVAALTPTKVLKFVATCAGSPLMGMAVRRLLTLRD